MSTLLACRTGRPARATRTARLVRALSTPAPRFHVLFCGSDDFSVAALDAVVRARDIWQSIHVVTPSPKAVGRGKAAKTYTLLAGRIADLALPAPFASSPAPDPAHLLITASFGHILPAPLLARFRPTHALNVHPSLLPAYRGAAPVQWAIARGERTTGVTVQTLADRAKGVDAGDILGAVGDVPIERDDAYDTLLPRLAHIGGDLLVDVLRELQAGTVTPRAQDAARVTRAPKITVDTARVDWSAPAADIARLHRGITHQQPLWATLPGGARVLLLDVCEGEAGGGDAGNDGTADAAAASAALDAAAAAEAPGTATYDKRRRQLRVRCGDGHVHVARVKPEAGRALAVADWWNGLPKTVRASRRVVLA